MSLWLVLLGVADYCYADYWYTAAMSMHWSQYSTASSSSVQQDSAQDRERAQTGSGVGVSNTYIHQTRAPHAHGGACAHACAGESACPRALMRGACAIAQHIYVCASYIYMVCCAVERAMCRTGPCLCPCPDADMLMMMMTMLSTYVTLVGASWCG